MCELRKPLDDLTSRASQNVKHLGEDWNLSYLEQEGAKNEKNPGRAYGKALGSVASWYLGGLLGGASGAGGAATGSGLSAAGEAGVGAGTIAAEEAAKQAAMQGLLSAAPGPGVAASGMGNVAAADTYLINAGYPNMAGGKMTGLLQTGSRSPASKYAMKQAIGMMNQPQQQPMQRPMPMPQQQSAPMTQMYGMDPMMLDEETKRRLRMAGYPI